MPPVRLPLLGVVEGCGAWGVSTVFLSSGVVAVEEAKGVPSQRPRLDRRRRISARQVDVKKRRVAALVIGFLILVIAGVLIAGFVMTFVLPSRHLVVRVNDVKYTRGDMVKLLRVRQVGMDVLGTDFNLGTDTFQALQTIVENEVIAQSAPRFGITVSDEDADAQIRALLQSRGDISPEQAEREFRERQRSFLNSVGISRDEHRQMIKKNMLRSRFREFIGQSVPAVAEQVRVHRLVMSNQGEIDIMQVKFKDNVGDTDDPEKLQSAFKDLVREFAVDNPEMVRRGGDLGWVPRDVITDYERHFFDLDIGKLSEPVPDADNASVVIFFMVSDRQAARELDPEDLDQLKTRALDNWINEERGNHDIYSKFNSDIYQWVVDQLKLTAKATPVPQPNPLGF